MTQRYQITEDGLAQAIKSAGFSSISAFAKAHQLNRSTIHKYLNGSGPISQSFYELCDAAQIDPLDLLVPRTLAQDIPHVGEIYPTVRTLSTEHPALAFILIGSRARGNAQHDDDWDLGISAGASAHDELRFIHLRSQIETMTARLPRSIDIINLDTAPAWLLQKIDYTPYYLYGNTHAWHYFLGTLHAHRGSR